jgi:hypothetical protein
MKMFKDFISGCCGVELFLGVFSTPDKLKNCSITAEIEPRV